MPVNTNKHETVFVNDSFLLNLAVGASNKSLLPGSWRKAGEWRHTACLPVSEEARVPTGQPQTEAFAPTSLGAQLLYRLGIWEVFLHFPVLPSPGADPMKMCAYIDFVDLWRFSHKSHCTGGFSFGGLRDCQSLAFHPFHSLVSHKHCGIVSLFSTPPFGLSDSSDGKLVGVSKRSLASVICLPINLGKTLFICDARFMQSFFSLHPMHTPTSISADRDLYL